MTRIGPLLGSGLVMGGIGGVGLARAESSVAASADTAMGVGSLVGGGALVALSLLSRTARASSLAAAVGAGLLGFGAATLLTPDASGRPLPTPRPSAGPAPGGDAESTTSERPEREQDDLPFNMIRSEGPTPNGGAYVISVFSDDAGRPAHPDEATRVVATEYDADGNAVFTTSGRLGDG